VKQSRIKKLIPKKLARRLARADADSREEIEALVDRESAAVVAKMKAKGYRLVTRLDSGEGIFVRDDDVVSLHVQLPTALYRRLEAACKERETTKRDIVIGALEAYLG